MQRTQKLSLALPDGVVVTATALTCDRLPSFDELVSLGRALLKLERGIQFWVGDWWVELDCRYGAGKEMAAAKKIFGYALHTIQNYASVARKVESSRRRELLCYSHHAEVAKFKPEQQTRWLDATEIEDLSVAELRQRIFAHRFEKEKSADQEFCYLLFRLKKAAEASSRFMTPPCDDVGFMRYLKSIAGSNEFAELVEAAEKANELWGDTVELASTTSTYKDDPAGRFQIYPSQVSRPA